MLKEKVDKLLQAVLDDNPSLFLIDYNITNDNSIGILIDGDNGVTVEDCITVSRAIEHNLDREEEDFSLEVGSKNTDAKINIAAEILKEEKPLVEQMNALGTSNADFKKYDELKERRKQIYLSAVPYLESVIEQKPENVEATRVLMNIYYQLDNEAKAKEMKAKLQSFEGN